MAAGDELVEVVDERGDVLGVVTRADMRAGNLRHRATYVVVTTTGGAVVAHRRADFKDVWPGRWDVAFGGVVGVGEPWRAAARRELAEEAGVEVAEDDLVELAGGAYTSAEVAVVGRAYTVVHDGPYPCPDGEVVALARVPHQALPGWLADHELCPDTWALVVPHLVAPPAE